jgi:hypothetical protein
MRSRRERCDHLAGAEAGLYERLPEPDRRLRRTKLSRQKTGLVKAERLAHFLPLPFHRRRLELNRASKDKFTATLHPDAQVKSLVLLAAAKVVACSDLMTPNTDWP